MDCFLLWGHSPKHSIHLLLLSVAFYSPWSWPHELAHPGCVGCVTSMVTHLRIITKQGVAGEVHHCLLCVSSVLCLPNNLLHLPVFVCLLFLPPDWLRGFTSRKRWSARGSIKMSGFYQVSWEEEWLCGPRGQVNNSEGDCLALLVRHSETHAALYLCVINPSHFSLIGAFEMFIIIERKGLRRTRPFISALYFLCQAEVCCKDWFFLLCSRQRLTIRQARAVMPQMSWS